MECFDAEWESVAERRGTCGHDFNTIFRATSRDGGSDGGRKGRSAARYVHDVGWHSMETPQSQTTRPADVCGVGGSKRGRLGDRAKVSCGLGVGLALAHRVI